MNLLPNSNLRQQQIQSYQSVNESLTTEISVNDEMTKKIIDVDEIKRISDITDSFKSLLDTHKNCLMRIRSTSRRQLLLLKAFLQKNNDETYYQKQLNNIDLLFAKHLESLALNYGLLEKEFSQHIMEEKKKCTKDILNIAKKHFEIFERWIRHKRTRFEFVQNHISYVNSGLNPKVAIPFAVGTLVSGPVLGATLSATYKITKFVSDQFPLFTPNFANTTNLFVKCGFRNHSTGHFSMFKISQTQGTIQVIFGANDECWVNFNLNENPIIEKEDAQNLAEILLEKFISGDINNQAIQKIYKELNELIIRNEKGTFYPGKCLKITDLAPLQKSQPKLFVKTQLAH